MPQIAIDASIIRERAAMVKQNEVVLFGTWGSSYSKRVEIALKLKGIPYEYVEEDLENKSESLLQYNPVHKKVPVLVYNGKPIAESLIILEYLDDCWENTPKLLPEDPYKRAKVRFWADFYDRKLSPISWSIMKSKGHEQEEAIKEFKECLTVFEEGLKKDFQDEFPFFDGKKLGFLDIVVGTTLSNYKAFNEAVAVVITPEKNPAVISWVDALRDHPLMKETLTPHDELVVKLRSKLPKPDPQAN